MVSWRTTVFRGLRHDDTKHNHSVRVLQKTFRMNGCTATMLGSPVSFDATQQTRAQGGFPFTAPTALIDRPGRPRGRREGARPADQRFKLLYRMKSPHFCTSPSSAFPQGMIGTLEVEFFGEPSISLSE